MVQEGSVGVYYGIYIKKGGSAAFRLILLGFQASASQAEGREFESYLPLFSFGIRLEVAVTERFLLLDSRPVTS